MTLRAKHFRQPSLIEDGLIKTDHISLEVTDACGEESGTSVKLQLGLIQERICSEVSPKHLRQACSSLPRFRDANPDFFKKLGGDFPPFFETELQSVKEDVEMLSNERAAPIIVEKLGFGVESANLTELLSEAKQGVLLSPLEIEFDEVEIPLVFKPDRADLDDFRALSVLQRSSKRGSFGPERMSSLHAARDKESCLPSRAANGDIAHPVERKSAHPLREARDVFWEGLVTNEGGVSGSLEDLRVCL